MKAPKSAHRSTHVLARSYYLAYVLLLLTTPTPTYSFSVSQYAPPSTSFTGKHHKRANENKQLAPHRGNLNGRHAVSLSSSSEDNIFNLPRGGNNLAFDLSNILAFVEKNFFLLGMIVSVSLARAFPTLGMNGGILRPELFIGKFGVALIFLFSGLSLELSELTDAVKNYKLNGLIQFMLFGAWPFLVGLPVTRGLQAFLPNLLPKSILDGLLIMTCLPTTVNMCIILTTAAGGNIATALCNAVISNLAGIFMTPALLLRFFGESIELPFVDMMLKLCNKVLLPVAIGQALRATPAKSFYKQNSKKFKRLQEIILLGIAWNAFCNAFSGGISLELRHGIVLLFLLPVLHLSAFVALFGFFNMKLLDFTRGEAVAATFCASQKTLAFGLPLINTIFEGNPNLAAYCAPLMFIHPLQLALGSSFVPGFTRFTGPKKEEDQI
eukprot:CAMPEP_0183317798 /NCGR_PEP_ID=MMETSP0160_2-20130417/58933_1 /TAXON_ID=2839 ORGANISM="Odontella Sinensis, Strain Grunow 1884" /NCGR_SAMPLE_ID=MMETSP0160_2 /ASSEMBLY_ACC=CAM_ASM_000250 /LENGTH=438 /DNA_ID=CAMNT_0025483901 /DNA_START=18 /DNA_END=1334 /DNA_ORIENTATION=+